MLTILLDQEAIEEALTNYISEDELNVDLTDRDVSIKLIMGRGDNGLRAEVQISSPNTSADESENDVPEDILETAEEGAEETSEDEPAVGPFD